VDDYLYDIFVDWSIETGTAWPDALRDGLRYWRCMLAIWSPERVRLQGQ
jgi:hypothetical protein